MKERREEYRCVVCRNPIDSKRAVYLGERGVHNKCYEGVFRHLSDAEISLMLKGLDLRTR